MKILLGVCLALLLASGAPAFAAATTPQTGHPSHTGQAGHDQDATGANNGDTSAAPQGGTDNRGARQRVHRQRHQFDVGERIRPRLLGGRHVVTDYARFGVDPPTRGDRWVKTRGQLLLVSADGVVKTVVPRHRGHRHRNAPPNDNRQQ